MQRQDAANLIAAGYQNVANPAQVWGTPEVADDYKLWANFGGDLSDNVEFFGNANYNNKEVTGGFYYRNPTNRGAVYSVDGGVTLLIGDLTRCCRHRQQCVSRPVNWRWCCLPDGRPEWSDTRRNRDGSGASGSKLL